MGWTISHRHDGNIIRIETAGRLSIEMLARLAVEAVEAGSLHGSQAYLADHRRAQVPPDFIAVFNQPAALDRLGFPRDSRIAQLYPPGLLANFRFLGTVALDRGFSVRIFDDVEAALAWLDADAGGARRAPAQPVQEAPRSGRSSAQRPADPASATAARSPSR